MSSKTTNINLRIEPELKDQAENICDSLGLTLSGAANLFFKQLIINKGFPFKLSVEPQNHYNLPPYKADYNGEQSYSDYIEAMLNEADKAVADGSVRYLSEEEVFPVLRKRIDEISKNRKI